MSHVSIPAQVAHRRMNRSNAWPERLYILDDSGRISYKGGNGPFKYDPKEVRAWLAQRYGEVKHAEPAPAKKS